MLINLEFVRIGALNQQLDRLTDRDERSIIRD